MVMIHNALQCTDNSSKPSATGPLEDTRYYKQILLPGVNPNTRDDVFRIWESE